MNKTIEKTWVFVSVEPDGSEELIILDTDKGDLMMLGTDKESAEAMAMHAQNVSDDNGWKIRLVEFTKRREVRLFTPHNKPVMKTKRGEQ